MSIGLLVEQFGILNNTSYNNSKKKESIVSNSSYSTLFDPTKD